MKQSVRRDALKGIAEYYTDSTSVRTKEREDAEEFNRAYGESLEAEWAEWRATMLRGINLDTGIRYTLAGYREIIDSMELTQDELFDASRRLDALDDEDDSAWAYQDERDIALLTEIGDANIDAMIAHHAQSLRPWM